MRGEIELSSSSVETTVVSADLDSETGVSKERRIVSISWLR